MSFKLEGQKYHPRHFGTKLTIIRSLHGFGTVEQFKICLEDVLSKNQHLSAKLFEQSYCPAAQITFDEALRTEPTTGELEILIEFEQGLHSDFAKFLHS